MEDKNLENLLRIGGILAQGHGIIAKLVVRDKRLTPEAKAIYSYIASFAGSTNGDLTAFPSVATMCKELPMSPSRFYNHRKHLIDYNYISIEREKKENIYGKNIYTIVLYPDKNTTINKESGRAHEQSNVILNNNTKNIRYIDDSLLEPDLKVKLILWLSYKEQRNEKVNELSMLEIINKLIVLQQKYGASAVINLISDCVSHGWKNIVYQNIVNYKSPTTKKQQNEATTSKDLDVVAEAENEKALKLAIQTYPELYEIEVKVRELELLTAKFPNQENNEALKRAKQARADFLAKKQISVKFEEDNNG